MDFFPAFILQRNKLRGTPHYSILLATLIPIVVLLLVKGNINILGDMYAFGLLGAFALTCVGMDIVRYRDRQARKSQPPPSSHARQPIASPIGQEGGSREDPSLLHLEGQTARPYLPQGTLLPSEIPEPPGRWTRSTFNFWLGIVTTLLVLTAWSTNLFAKPLATAFGGAVTVIGMAIAYTNYALSKRKGRVSVITTGVEKNFPGAVLAVLSATSKHNEAIINAAVNNTGKKPIVFLYLGQQTSDMKPRLFRLIEPHLNDPQAREILGRANHLAEEAKVECRFVYRRQAPDAVYRVWQALHPVETIVDAQQASLSQQIHPDRISRDSTPDGEVVHLLKESAATT